MARKPQPGALERLFEELKSDMEKIIAKEVSKTVKAEMGKIKTGRVKSTAAVESAAKPAPVKRRGRKPGFTSCSVEGCDKPHYAKGLCSTHYQRERLGLKVTKRKKTAKGVSKKKITGAKRGPKPRAKKA